MIGMAIAQGLEERGQVGATHMGTGFDAWYPGLHRLQAGVPEHLGVLDRDRALSVRDAARLHAERLPAEHARPSAAGALHEPVAGRLVAAARRRGVHGDRVARRCSTTRRATASTCCSIAIAPAAADREVHARRRRTPMSSRRQQRDPVAAVELLRRLAFQGVRVSQLTAPSRRRGRDLPRRHVGHSDGPGVRRDWRGRCSTCSAIPTCASRRTVRSSSRTTPPAGRCRYRWASP